MVVGRGEQRSGACCKGEGVDKAHHISADGLGSVAHTAEHVLELPALLNEDGERALPAGELRHDVGDLRRDHAHLVRGLGRRRAQPSHSRAGLLQLIQVRTQRSRINAPDAGHRFLVGARGLAARLKLCRHAADFGNLALRAALDLRRRLFCARTHPRNAGSAALAFTAGGVGKVVQRALDFSYAGFGLGAVNLED